MAVNIRTTFNPGTIITVSDTEYADLERQGLIYSVESSNPNNGPKVTDARRRIAAIASAFRAYSVAYPPLFSPTPTVTFVESGSTTLGGTPQSIRCESPAVGHIGIVEKYDQTYFAMGSWCQARGTAGTSEDILTAAIEYFYRAGAGSGSYWVWIDGQPVTAAPVAWTGSTNATQRLKIVFPGVERHRIEVRTDLLQLQAINIAAGDSINAAPRRPARLQIVGDSLTDGSGAAIAQLTWPSHLGRLLDFELIGNAIGGQGYVSGSQPFTHPDRIVAYQDPTTDAFLFHGSVNDNAASPAAVQAAAELCYQTIYDANPEAPILVVGPSPTGGVSSVAADVRANADAVRAAAMTFSDLNVIGWVDPLMTRNALGTWYGGMPVAAGQRVIYQGGVYEATRNTTSGGFGSIDFARVSPFYGTGRVGTVANDGNRDQFILAADNTHWTVKAHEFMGHYFAHHLAQAFAAFMRGDFYIHE